ncbi:MAG: diacylglycerol kinase [Pseudomonadota bacterium]
MNEFKRLAQATRNSLAGIAFAWRDEQAFRSQVLALLVLVPVAVWLARSPTQLALLVSACLLVLTCELLNTGIEAIVDRASPEIHPLAKKAKDCGSAGVMMSMVIWFLIWGGVLLENFRPS